MASIKITDLTAYTDAASTDVLPIVDVSNDVTKKISISNLLKTAPLGTAAAPGIAFDGDPNTGIYSPSADQLTLATNGAGRLFVDASGNVSVGTYAAPDAALTLSRSGNSYLFLHDATSSALDSAIGNVGGSIVFRNGANVGTVADLTERMRLDSIGRLGLGTSGPTESIHTTGALRVTGTQTTAGTGIYLDQTAGVGNVSVYGPDNSTQGTFRVYTATANGGTGSAKLIVDSSGRVGIGTTSPSDTLTVAGSGKFGPSGDTNGYLTLDGVNNSYFALTATNGYIGADSNLILCANNTATERARIDSSGRLLVGTSSSIGGITQIVGSQAGGSTPLLHLRGIDAVGGGQRAVSIDFSAITDDTGSVYTNIARISAFKENNTSGNEASSLTFSTTADGASSPTERVRIASTGRITIEANSTTGGIYVNNWSTGAGNSTVKYNSTGGQLTYDTSSRLVKTDIEDCPYGLEQIKLLRPRQYFRVDDQRIEIGFVADEVANVMPEFVPVGPKSIITKNEDDTEEIPLSVNYDKITAVLAKALQEAISKIETLEAKVAALEAA